MYGAGQGLCCPFLYPTLSGNRPAKSTHRGSATTCNCSFSPTHCRQSSTYQPDLDASFLTHGTSAYFYRSWQYLLPGLILFPPTWLNTGIVLAYKRLAKYFSWLATPP